MMLESEKPVAQRVYKGSVDCFMQVMKKEGAAGMYKVTQTRTDTRQSFFFITNQLR
jgi:hypothetical protein